MILGINDSHNSSVCLLDDDGKILYAVAEERFSRRKQQGGFPWRSLATVTDKLDHNTKVCIGHFGPFKTALRFGFFTLNSLLKWKAGVNMQYIRKRIRAIKVPQGTSVPEQPPPIPNLSNLLQICDSEPFYVDHHLSHAASAYYLSGFDKAIVVSVDGVGNCLSSGVYFGEEGRIKPIDKYYFNQFPIGKNYEIITGMLGFNFGEHAGKITGLAAHGTYNQSCIDTMEKFFRKMWRLRFYGNGCDADFYSHEGKSILRGRIRNEAFGSYSNEDIAAAIQYLTERDVLWMIRKILKGFPAINIALAGGVFGNVLLNQKIKQLGFENIFVQPGMSDEGLCLGTACYYLALTKGLRPYPIKHVFLGPDFSRREIIRQVELNQLVYREYEDIAPVLGRYLSDGKIIARVEDSLEFGPRALGHRSVLYQTTDPTVNDWLNKKLHRTEFMPFAPATLFEHRDECFLDTRGAEHTAEFMTITFNCTEKMKQRSPAVVHIDGTARPQLVKKEKNPTFYRIIEEYYKITGIPSILNTSLNIHGEPIVCTIEEAVRTFLQADLDVLAINNFVIVHPKNKILIKH